MPSLRSLWKSPPKPLFSAASPGHMVLGISRKANNRCFLAISIVLGTCVASSHLNGQEVPTAKKQWSPTGTSRISRKVSDQLKSLAESYAGEDRGYLIYIQFADGEEWSYAAGSQSIGGAAATPTDHFAIGSITKLFTAVSILQLSETDRLDLEAPLTDYFDRDLLAVLVGGDQGNVTDLKVRHLLSHSTGIGDYINIGSDADAFTRYGKDRDRSYAPMELIELTRSYTEDPDALPKGHPPLPCRTLKGMGIESYDEMPGAFYSNTGYIMLGVIIEKASGMKYEDYVTQNILKPLGLEETGFGTRSAKSDFTEYSKGVADGPVVMSPSLSWCAGNVISTTRDLADFLEGALAGKLFKKDATLEFWKTQSFTPLMGVAVMPEYGHGLMRKSVRDQTLLGHDGQTFGATALVAHCPELEFTIVLARNESQHSNMWLTARIILGLVKKSME